MNTLKRLRRRVRLEAELFYAALVGDTARAVVCVRELQKLRGRSWW